MPFQDEFSNVLNIFKAGHYRFVKKDDNSGYSGHTNHPIPV